MQEEAFPPDTPFVLGPALVQQQQTQVHLFAQACGTSSTSSTRFRCAASLEDVRFSLTFYHRICFC